MREFKRTLEISTPMAWTSVGIRWLSTSVMLAGAIWSSALSCTGSAKLENPVNDSGEWAYVAVAPAIRWVDNDRALFLGRDGDPKLPRSQVFVLKLWNVSTGAIEEVDRGLYSFYYARARDVLLKFKPGAGPGEFILESQHFGTRQLANQATMKGRIRFDRLNARVYQSESRPGFSLGRDWRPLLDGDGYLDFGPLNQSHEPAKVQHVDQDGRVRTTLNIATSDVGEIHYSEFLNQYLFADRDGRRQLDDGRCGWSVHWFSPSDGDVKPFEIPVSCEVLMQSDPELCPSRAGFVLKARARNRFGNADATQGLYLIGESGERRIMQGWVQFFAVSPDGCKIAAVHSKSMRDDLENRSSTIKAVDLCKPGV